MSSFSKTEVMKPSSSASKSQSQYKTKSKMKMLTNALVKTGNASLTVWKYSKHFLWIGSTLAILFLIPFGFEISHDQIELVQKLQKQTEGLG